MFSLKIRMVIMRQDGRLAKVMQGIFALYMYIKSAVL